MFRELFWKAFPRNAIQGTSNCKWEDKTKLLCYGSFQFCSLNPSRPKFSQEKWKIAWQFCVGWRELEHFGVRIPCYACRGADCMTWYWRYHLLLVPLPWNIIDSYWIDLISLEWTDMYLILQCISSLKSEVISDLKFILEESWGGLSSTHSTPCLSSLRGGCQGEHCSSRGQCQGHAQTEIESIHSRQSGTTCGNSGQFRSLPFLLISG